MAEPGAAERPRAGHPGEQRARPTSGAAERPRAGHPGEQRARPTPGAYGRAQWLPAVVAIAIGLAIGTLIVTNGADSTPTPSTLSSISTNPVVVGPGQPLPEAAAGTEPTTYYGALGSLDTATRVRASVATAQGHGPVIPAPAGVPCVRAAPRAVGLLVVGAFATGTVNQEPVTVLIGVAADGAGIAVVLRASDCTIVERVDT